MFDYAFWEIKVAVFAVRDLDWRCTNSEEGWLLNYLERSKITHFLWPPGLFNICCILGSEAACSLKSHHT